MKKLIFLALLCLSFVAVHAQHLIINHSRCAIQVTPVCYDPVKCVSNVCGPVTIVPPGASIPLPPPCNCQPPSLQGYIVCYAQICPNICTTISDAAGGPCPNFPIQAVLPPCPQCSNFPLSISWDSMGNMVIM